MTRVLVNGDAGAAVDPLDRGLLYGDGLFETLAIVAGRPRFLEWHFERLIGGSRVLGFPAPDLEALRADIAKVATEPRGVVKIVLTRGPASGSAGAGCALRATACSRALST